MRRIATALGFLTVFGLTVLGISASGQQQDAADAPTDELPADQTTDNGFILNFIEERISGPGRRISLSGVEGALSSQARIAGITVSDDQGPWLRIENVVLDWNRLALLRRQVTINELSFGSIDFLRKPIPVESAPEPEAASSEPFSLPDLPVSVRVDKLLAERVSIDESVIGEAVAFNLEGHASLADGALESGLDVRRLDEPGGTLSLDADFSNENREIALDLDVQEPAGGLISTLANIEGQPPLSLKVAGQGPLENVDITFDLQADSSTLAEGVLALRGQEDGQGFDLGLTGEIAPLIPADYRGFFEGETRVDLSGVSKAAGGVRIDLLGVQGAVLSLNGRLETGADSFLRSLNLSGSLGDPGEEPVLLPVPGADTRINSAMLYVNYGAAARWDGIVVLDRLQAADLSIEDLTLRMGGLARNLDDPATRDVTVSLEGLATGLSSANPDVDAALGQELDLFVDAALPSGAPIELRQVQITGEALSVFAAGTLDKLVYDGRAAIRFPDLAVLSGVANRDLSGGVTLRANGMVAPLTGKFDLTLDGSTTDVSLGDPRADALLAGETVISGRAVRDEGGIRTEDLRIENPQLQVSSDGTISSARTDIGFDARLSDLGLLDPRFAGALTATGRAEGSDGQPIDLAARVALPEGRIMDKPARDLQLAFDGQKDGREIRGSLSGDGTLAELALDLAGEVASGPDARSVEGLDLSLGSLRVSGDARQATGGPVTGELTLRAPDLAPIAELAQIEATGAISATLGFDGTGQGQSMVQDLDVQAAIRDLALNGTQVNDFYADVAISDLLGVPMAEGEVNGTGIVAGGLDIATLDLRASRETDTATRLAGDARFTSGTLVDLSGLLAEAEGGGFAATLEALRIRGNGQLAQLADPSTVTVREGNVSITPLRLDLGEGYLTAQGDVGETMSLDVDLSRVPLSIANLIVPSLGLTGTLDGTADVRGTRTAPDVAFNVTGEGLGSEFSANAGLPPLSVEAEGRTSGSLLTVDAALTGADALSATASGQVPLAAEEAFDLTVDLASFPLVIVDRIAGNQGLRGALTGRAHLTGPQSAPEAEFNVEGSGLTARVLSENAVPPFSLSLNGTFADNVVTLAALEADGAYGFNLSGGGTIPLAGPGLDARLSGVVPLEMATPVLAQRAASATGQINVNATAQGSLAEPRMDGAITLAGGTFTDPESNLRLENVGFDIALDLTRVVINQFRAESVAGGNLTGSGDVSLAAAQGYPADIEVNFNQIRYTDGAFLSTQLDGVAAVQGPLVGDGGRIFGRITLGKTEISIAEGFGGAGGAALEEIRHLRPPPRVVQALERAGVGQSEEESGGGPSGGGGLALDIRISAPNQIFIRGRGLDAELGGEVRIGGTTSDIAPVGEFEMRRGRISILTQRIDFTEGQLELDGNLDPLIYFVAESRSGDVTAIVTVSGRASDPEITFSSSPELPEDEVLARLLFNRAAQDLSPFQLAQLAAAAAELAGVSSGPGILSSLRSATGLDNLDLVTNEDGTTAVSAGKYLADDVYVDVQTNGQGESQVEIVYDVSDYFTARGAVESDGNTIFGLFFERDY